VVQCGPIIPSLTDGKRSNRGQAPDDRALPEITRSGILKRPIQALGALSFIKAFSSSIGKKVVMAITGLALCGFLLIHLGGILLLSVGAEKYSHYAHTPHAQELLLLVAEVALLILFVGHIWLAFVTKMENDAARPVVYAVRRSKMDEGPLAGPASSVM